MVDIDLFDPTVQVVLGGYCLTSGISLELLSSRAAGADWAEVRLSPAYAGKLQIPRLAPARVSLGYGAAATTVLQGYVAEVQDGGLAIRIKDGMLRLERTRITDTYLDARPQEIVELLLRRAGVTRCQIDAAPYPTKRTVVVRQMSGAALLAHIGRLWDISVPYFFAGDTFYWGCDPPQGAVYRFDYGRNILSLAHRDGLWELETVSAPFIAHSQRILVDAPAVAGLRRVEKIRYRTSEAGFVRSTIYFTDKEAET